MSKLSGGRGEAGAGGRWLSLWSELWAGNCKRLDAWGPKARELGAENCSLIRIGLGSQTSAAILNSPLQVWLLYVFYFFVPPSTSAKWVLIMELTLWAEIE